MIFRNAGFKSYWASPNSFENARTTGEAHLQQRIFTKIKCNDQGGKANEGSGITVFERLRCEAVSLLPRDWIDEPAATLTTSTGSYRRLRKSAQRAHADTRTGAS